LKIKLDENIGRRYGAPLLSAGHDVGSVSQQRMSGASDRSLVDTCRKEGRCLVTLDHEFGNPLIFDPSTHAGIVLIRLPRRATPHALLTCMRTLAAALEDSPIQGRLWIVQPGRVREYQQE
jgi:predicted nuclease of predicted toxin-antitoxin system